MKDFLIGKEDRAARSPVKRDARTPRFSRKGGDGSEAARSKDHVAWTSEAQSRVTSIRRCAPQIDDRWTALRWSNLPQPAPTRAYRVTGVGR
jgi:hypothetical protein